MMLDLSNFSPLLMVIDGETLAPADAATVLQNSLWNVIAEVVNPDDVYGIPSMSKYPNSLPSSPGMPCMALKMPSKTTFLPSTVIEKSFLSTSVHLPSSSR